MSLHDTGWHQYAASFISLGFIGNRCGICGDKKFLGGYKDERCNRIVERLNKTWRVR